MPTPSHLWIERADQLPQLAARLADAPWVALDTEGNSMFVYRERCCLLQLNLGGTLVLVDTWALLKSEEFDGSAPSRLLEPIRAQLERTDRPCFLHGGEYDCGVLRRDFEITLGGVWDTQQAASLLGWPKTGYGALVERVCGLKLDKAFTDYDWGTRPIDSGALSYALEDVVHLPDVATHLREAVATADLVEEHAIACAAVASASWSGGFDPAGFWHLKGLRDLPSSAMPLLHTLWVWRDAVARLEDRPAGRVMNNEQLLAVARRSPSSVADVQRAGAKAWLISKYGKELQAALERAAQVRPRDLPPAPDRREVDPEELQRERSLKEWRRVEAERRKVPFQVVLPARALDHLKRHGAGDLASVPQLGPKRAALYGDALRKVCGSSRS